MAAGSDFSYTFVRGNDTPWAMAAVGEAISRIHLYVETTLPKAMSRIHLYVRCPESLALKSSQTTLNAMKNVRNSPHEIIPARQILLTDIILVIQISDAVKVPLTSPCSSIRRRFKSSASGTCLAGHDKRMVKACGQGAPKPDG